MIDQENIYNVCDTVELSILDIMMILLEIYDSGATTNGLWNLNGTKEWHLLQNCQTHLISLKVNVYL